jgi:capsular polysaccharide biosynthesis protein
VTIEEMFRRIVRAHLGVILVCVLLPVAVAATLAADRSDPTIASLRLQVISGAPKSATEAEGISSRVLAIATTPSLLDAALGAADAERNVQHFAATAVTAQRLGESSIVELSVTDDDPLAAGRIVSQLAERVALFMNHGDQAAFRDTMASLADQIRAATIQRDKLVGQLKGIADLTAREDLQVQIQSANQLLNQLSAQRAMLVTADTKRDQVVPIGNKPDVRQMHSSMLPQLALAVLLGLVLGLTAAALLETFRPRVNGIRALARLLQAPVLGKSTEDIGSLHNTMALAARRQGVDAVVLVGADDGDEETVSRLLFMLSGYPSTPPRVRKGSNTPAGHDGDAAFDLDGPDLTGFSDVRFTGLSAVTPQDEMTAGVVVVSGGTVLLRRLDDLDDVLKAVRWPVLGLVQGPPRRRFGRSA